MTTMKGDAEIVAERLQSRAFDVVNRHGLVYLSASDPDAGAFRMEIEDGPAGTSGLVAVRVSDNERFRVNVAVTLTPIEREST